MWCRSFFSGPVDLMPATLLNMKFVIAVFPGFYEDFRPFKNSKDTYFAELSLIWLWVFAYLVCFSWSVKCGIKIGITVNNWT